MSVVYGYETARRDDPIIKVVDRAVNLAVASIRPEVAAFLGFFPFRESSILIFALPLVWPHSAVHSDLVPRWIV